MLLKEHFLCQRTVIIINVVVILYIFGVSGGLSLVFFIFGIFIRIKRYFVCV